ncbi:YybH family protein [Flagellimonas sp.]|uniref:YybH family protein n=1 Tax=Flagellimonas sp. TaxID=2058762 RepID=UPI003B5C90E0
MKIAFLSILFLVPVLLVAQYDFEPSPEHPFGLPNPNAPKELLDFAPLIGECNCKSVTCKADQTWAEPVDMVWRFKYIMNGMAIQDETLKEDQTYSGSIRQFSQDSTRWYVHYYSTRAVSTTLRTWEGNRNEEGKIVLYREQKAPNGTEGFYRLSFYDIDEKGFKWVGEWVDKTESVVFPTWKIDCSNGKVSRSDSKEKNKIIAASKKFSKAYMAQDFDTMADIYTYNAKLIPLGIPIVEGREAIKKRWEQGKDTKIISHSMDASEINIIDNYAYDYGYYSGTSQKGKEPITKWKGKYVVVWKKEEGSWKMYIDIWNRLKD